MAKPIDMRYFQGPDYEIIRQAYEQKFGEPLSNVAFCLELDDRWVGAINCSVPYSPNASSKEVYGPHDFPMTLIIPIASDVHELTHIYGGDEAAAVMPEYHAVASIEPDPQLALELLMDYHLGIPRKGTEELRMEVFWQIYTELETLK